MGKKIYTRDGKGGISFSSERKSGEVRIPNYVYDLWLPLLGIEAIGVYSVYCRLEREGMVSGIGVKDLAGACRIGDKRLVQINEMLEQLGFIQTRKPSGSDRLKHYTTEIVVLDAPQSVAADIVEKYQKTSGYTPLSHWLVDRHLTTPEASPDDAGSATQRLEEASPDDATIASLSLHPSNVESYLVEKVAPSGAADATVSLIPSEADSPKGEKADPFEEYVETMDIDESPEPQFYECTSKDIAAMIAAWWDWVPRRPTKNGRASTLPEQMKIPTNREYAENLFKRGVRPSDFMTKLGVMRNHPPADGWKEMTFSYAAKIVEDFAEQDRKENYYTEELPRITPKKPGVLIDLGDLTGLSGYNLWLKFRDHPDLLIDYPPPFISLHHEVEDDEEDGNGEESEFERFTPADWAKAGMPL